MALRSASDSLSCLLWPSVICTRTMLLSPQGVPLAPVSVLSMSPSLRLLLKIMNIAYLNVSPITYGSFEDKHGVLSLPSLRTWHNIPQAVCVQLTFTNWVNNSYTIKSQDVILGRWVHQGNSCSPPLGPVTQGRIPGLSLCSDSRFLQSNPFLPWYMLGSHGRCLLASFSLSFQNPFLVKEFISAFYSPGCLDFRMFFLIVESSLWFHSRTVRLGQQGVWVKEDREGGRGENLREKLCLALKSESEPECSSSVLGQLLPQSLGLF